MMKYYNETVAPVLFNELREGRHWSYTMPIRKRYRKFLPKQAFSVGEDIILILEGPKVIKFRKRWSLRSFKRGVRLVYIINDGSVEPYLKVHLVWE